MDIDGATGASPLNGETIRFRQDYYLYQIGLRGSYRLELNKYIALKTQGEADWGPVVGFNEDHHLQREGNLYGYITSSGNSLYFSTGLEIIIANTVAAGITMDYSWIRTTGEIRHYNAPLGEN
jgi:outer membrane protease